MFLDAQKTNNMHSNNLNFVSSEGRGMIFPKWEDRFFHEREDLHLLEITAETTQLFKSKTFSYLNLNISRTKNGRNKL